MLAVQNIPNWNVSEYWTSSQTINHLPSHNYWKLIQSGGVSNADHNFCYASKSSRSLEMARHLDGTNVN